MREVLAPGWCEGLTRRLLARAALESAAMRRKKRPDGMPRVTLKNINRIEGQGQGWRVHVKRQRREHVQYVPDGMDGPFQSLRDAIDWRDGLWRRLVRRCTSPRGGRGGVRAACSA